MKFPGHRVSFWPGQRAAYAEALRQLRDARECVRLARERNDPVYLDMARVHITTARNFHRNAWRGPKR